MNRFGFAALAGALLLAVSAQAGELHWARSWAASPQGPLVALPGFPPPPAIENQTLRQLVRISGGGAQVRIRFTNEFGSAPVRIGAAHLALAGAGGTIRPGTDHVLTFAGRPTAVIRAGAPLVSDPVDMTLADLSKLAISVYLPEKVETCTCHGTSAETGYAVLGDQTGAAALVGAAPLAPRALISAVEVARDGPAKTIVAFGDSITDGVGATQGADRRWPDRLAERLVRRGGAAVFVANQGISGNRVLNDGFGVSALERFDRDVLATPGLAYVIVFEGINDIGISFAPRRGEGGPLAEFMKRFGGAPVGADDIIAGYRQLIARAHAAGVKIYGATITPYQGAGTASAEGEAARQAVNSWIRTSGAFDAVIDFDAVWRDPARPGQIREGYHMGDHLHGNDAGYAAMADSIDLALFK